MCLCGLEPADVTVTVTLPFLGRVSGRVGRRCAASAAHIAKLILSR